MTEWLKSSRRLPEAGSGEASERKWLWASHSKGHTSRCSRAQGSKRTMGSWGIYEKLREHRSGGPGSLCSPTAPSSGFNPPVVGTKQQLLVAQREEQSPPHAGCSPVTMPVTLGVSRDHQPRVLLPLNCYDNCIDKRTYVFTSYLHKANTLKHKANVPK